MLHGNQACQSEEAYPPPPPHLESLQAQVQVVPIVLEQEVRPVVIISINSSSLHATQPHSDRQDYSVGNMRPAHTAPPAA